MIRLTCPFCATALDLAELPPDTPVRCPACQQVFQPAPRRESPPLAPVRAAAPPPAPKPKKPRRGRRDSSWLIDDIPPDPLMKPRQHHEHLFDRSRNLVFKLMFYTVVIVILIALAAVGIIRFRPVHH